MPRLAVKSARWISPDACREYTRPEPDRKQSRLSIGLLIVIAAGADWFLPSCQSDLGPPGLWQPAKLGFILLPGEKGIILLENPKAGR